MALGLMIVRVPCTVEKNWKGFPRLLTRISCIPGLLLPLRLRLGHICSSSFPASVASVVSCSTPITLQLETGGNGENRGGQKVFLRLTCAAIPTARHVCDTNKVEVRFWVDSGFRILSLDVSALNSRRLILRIENRTGSANYAVVCSETVSAPLSAWATATVVNAADESDQIRRLEVDLPAGIAGRCFVRVRQE